MELEEKHIKNLKVVLNRNKLLELLPQNAIVAELGVDEGDFSIQISRITKPIRLYLIDIWGSERYSRKKMKTVRNKFNKEIENGEVVIICNDSITALNTFSDNFFDWIYIDTSHTYQQTIDELVTSMKKIKPGGIIAGHDYTQGNVRKGSRYGVIHAVHEFCIEYHWEMIYLTHESHRYLSFAINEINE